MRITTERISVPFYMTGDIDIHKFLQKKKIKAVEERCSSKTNEPYWVYESNDKFRLALKEYYATNRQE